MNQSRLGSAVEAIVNILIGMGVALGSQYVVFPLVGIHGVSHATHLWITFWFTLISFVRSYFVRRWFNQGWFERLRNKKGGPKAAPIRAGR